MALPASGEISFANIRSITGPASGEVSLNNTNIRYLALADATLGTTINLTNFYGKPAATSRTYSTGTGFAVNTTYTFICPAYQNVTATISGAGGGGGGGDNHNIYGAGNSGNPGGPGVGSTLSFTGFSASGGGGSGGAGNGSGAVAPAGGASSTGSFIGPGGSLTAGAGGAGGPPGSPQQGGVWGGIGGAGGRAIIKFVFNSTTYFPGYGGTISVYFGAGGYPGTNAGYGTPGSITFVTS